MNIKDIDELFEHSLVISCNERRLAYFNIVMKMFGFPEVQHFQAFTPEIYEIYKQDKLAKSSQQRCLQLFTMLINEYCLCKNRFWLMSNFEKHYFDNVSKNKYNNINNYVISYAVMSHLLCVYYAKLSNWPYVMIFEDDAFPKQNAYQLVNDAISYIDRYQEEYNDEVNLYIPGVQCIIHPFIEKILYQEQFASIKKLAGLSGIQTYIVNSSIYDIYIQSNIALFLEGIENQLITLCNQFNDINIFYNLRYGQSFVQNNVQCFNNDNNACNCVKYQTELPHLSIIDNVLQSYEKCIKNSIIVKDQHRKLVKASDAVPCCFDKQTGRMLDDKLEQLERLNK